MLRPAEIKSRVKSLVEEYGWIAFAVWFGLFGATLVLAATLIELGVDWPWLTEKVGSAGTWAAAYVVTKLLGPVRFAVFAAVLPFVGRWKKSRLSVPTAMADGEPAAPR